MGRTGATQGQRSTIASPALGSPDHPICYPGAPPPCPPPPPPPPCPTPYVLYLAAANETNATNTSFQYWITSNSPLPYGDFSTLTWGPNTSYAWTAANNGVSTVTPVDAFIDFLKPSTTYYYHIHATSSCTDSSGTHHYVGDYYGNWKTKADYATSVSGFVTDAHGNPAPDNVAVEASCLNTYYGNFESWGYTGDSSPGHYTIDISMWQIPNYGLCNGIAVRVLNNYPNMNVWPGYWNETIVTWAPQVVDFQLPANVISPYIPQAVDFSNANSTNGWTGMTSVSYTQTTSYTTSESYCWHLFFWGGCSSSSQPVFDATHSYTSQAGNLVVSQRFWTSGTVEFAAMDRVAAITSTDYYSDYGSPQFPAQQQVNDWLIPTNTSSSHYYINTWGSSGYGTKVTYQYPQGGSVTTITTSSTTGITEWDLSVDIGLVGVVGISIPVVGQSWSQTSTSTYQHGLTWNVTVPQSIGTICAVVYGEGGSQAQNTADNIGVWLYDPGFAGNDCPLP